MKRCSNEQLVSAELAISVTVGSINPLFGDSLGGSWWCDHQRENGDGVGQAALSNRLCQSALVVRYLVCSSRRAQLVPAAGGGAQTGPDGCKGCCHLICAAGKCCEEQKRRDYASQKGRVDFWCQDFNNYQASVGLHKSAVTLGAAAALRVEGLGPKPRSCLPAHEACVFRSAECVEEGGGMGGQKTLRDFLYTLGWGEAGTCPSSRARLKT
eukprot:1161734-Pelagomonas_calceolata.AAC.9